MFYKNYEKLKIYQDARNIAESLQKHGHQAYFVGGCVRDMLLGRQAKDFDLVTSALPNEVINLFPNSHLVGACFGVVNIAVDHIHYEVATFREERNYEDGRHPQDVKYTTYPKLDSQRRDFTINGLYFDPLTGRILDFVGGQHDLKRGILDTIGNADERFSEDYLRILRAIRFAVRYDFELTESVKTSIQKLAPKVAHLSAERIREELNRMMIGPSPEKAMTLLKNLGLLAVILPEVEALFNVPQPKKFHPEGCVFTHTLLMLKHMGMPSIELAWAAILHDIAKPETLIYDDEGIEHFYGHEYQGADLAASILKRLAFPNKMIDNICHAIRNHMRYAHVCDMKEAKLRRLIAEPTFPLELELHRIDCISSHKCMTNVVFLLDKVNQLKEEIELPEPLITGKDLIKCGLVPGPIFKTILTEAMNAQLENRISSKDEALQLANSIINSK